jgi:formylglycine-generating enzyme required for sulfatase activity
VSPFFLDVTEFTVGHFNSILSKIPASFTMPLPPTSQGSIYDVACTWLGPGNSANDKKPVNCLPVATAAEACTLVGGLLPTEAQWEHAARGRGQGRAYPWGNQTPACCSANVQFALHGPFSQGLNTSCKSSGTVPVGSFESDPCGGVNDVSRDSVLDLAGNVSEWVADQYYAYDDPCWGQGVPLNPMCPVIATNNNLARGGDFSGDDANPVDGRGAMREQGLTGPGVGFRCAYKDGAP